MLVSACRYVVQLGYVCMLGEDVWGRQDVCMQVCEHADVRGDWALGRYTYKATRVCACRCVCMQMCGGD